MTKLNVVYQCCDLPGSRDLSIEQMKRLIDSGLVDNAQVHLSLNGNLVNFLDLVQFVEPYSNIRINHTSDRADLMEYPALMLVKDIADAAVEEEYILYFHLKGITKLNHQGIHDWRRYMEYWHIDRYRDCIAKLDEGYDTCGTNYIRGTFVGADLKVHDWPHYSGGFWWARTSYIKKLDRLPHPDNYVMGSVSPLTGYVIDKNLYRYDHEAWISSGKPNWTEIHSSPGGTRDDSRGHYPGWHYHYTYPESNYK